jgi:probable HAF family extracellular repeat protein
MERFHRVLVNRTYHHLSRVRIVTALVAIGLFYGPVPRLLAVEASFAVLTYTNGQDASDFVTPHAISADGTVIVGQRDLEEAFRWTASDGIIGMGSISDFNGDTASSANGVSGNGRIIVGESSATSRPSVAFRWTAETGMVALKPVRRNRSFLRANAISGDGSVIVGDGLVVRKGVSILNAFRGKWSQPAVSLGQLRGGTQGSSGLGVSSNGSVIVGHSDSRNSTNYNEEAFCRTTRAGMIGLGDLLGGPFASLGRAVSADGTVVVGESWSEIGWHAYRWTRTTGMVALGQVHSNDVSIAESVSADGSRIVGTASYYDDTIQDERFVAFIWDAEHGMRDLNAVLQEDYGLDLQGLALTDATAISADGTTVAGRTEGNSGYYGWVAHIP